LYIYYYNSILSLRDIEENKLVNKLLDIINKKDNDLLDKLYEKDMQFYENNNKLVDIIEEKDRLIEQLRKTNTNLLEEKAELLEGELGSTHRRWEYFRDHISNILD
jgi:predicted nuclease with TOPRIM domain